MCIEIREEAHGDGASRDGDFHVRAHVPFSLGFLWGPFASYAHVAADHILSSHPHALLPRASCLLFSCVPSVLQQVTRICRRLIYFPER